MVRSRIWAKSPLFVVAIGAMLFLAALAHHAREFLAMGGSAGPLIAFLLDGVPALGLAYGGYRLSGSDLSPQGRRTVLVWCLGGGVLSVAVIGATFFVRTFEGRVVVEPVFPLLIAAEVGAIAGLVAGYSNARARADAHRARTVSDALAFVNQLVRHDLRNDLVAIRSYAELLEDGRSSTGSSPSDDGHEPIARKADEALARIETSHAIMETLVDDPGFEPLDLVPVVAELTARVEDTFDVTVTREFPDEALVLANSGVRSVVDNLLENAAEHNDSDAPHIDVALDVDPDTVSLTVRDNGPGIPDDRKRTIFETGEDELDSGGLALVRTLVDQYDGDVWVEDNELGGATFVVEFPRAERGGQPSSIDGSSVRRAER